MKLNSHVIFLIAIVGIITAGVVGATILNNGSMKQVDFDGTKVSVPSDSNFVKTGDGYADSKYGITIHLFKDKGSMINFLNNQPGMFSISLKNQPPQSFAFTKGEDTNIFIASESEAISIGAKDKGLVSDMANSVVFSNHQKSAKPDSIFPVIFAPPYLSLDDFNYINALSIEVNNDVFNNVTVSNTINQLIFEHNGAIDNNTYSQYTAKEFTPNTASSNSNNNQQNTSLLDNQNVANVLNSVSSDNPSNDNSAGGGSGSVSSGSGSSGGSNPPSSNSNNNGAASSVSGNNQQHKVNQSQLKTNIEKSLPSGYSISKIEDKNGFYLVSIKDPKGKIHEYKYDYFGRQTK